MSCIRTNVKVRFWRDAAVELKTSAADQSFPPQSKAVLAARWWMDSPRSEGSIILQETYIA